MRLGPWEIALIAMFVVVLFGARKIPDIMRGLGLGVKEFKAGLQGKESEEGASGKTKSEEKSDKERPEQK